MESTKVGVRRSVAEKRRIVELKFQSGQSVARVALAEGVNSHQVFQWRRAYRVASRSINDDLRTLDNYRVQSHIPTGAEGIPV